MNCKIPSQQVRFKGITQAARAMGVSYDHLHKVLDGSRQSKRLMALMRQNYPQLVSLHMRKQRMREEGFYARS